MLILPKKQFNIILLPIFGNFKIDICFIFKHPCYVLLFCFIVNVLFSNEFLVSNHLNSLQNTYLVIFRTNAHKSVCVSGGYISSRFYRSWLVHLEPPPPNIKKPSEVLRSSAFVSENFSETNAVYVWLRYFITSLFKTVYMKNMQFSKQIVFHLSS